jgi:polyisoprenyl-phosphate glycosyltransferase
MISIITPAFNEAMNLDAVYARLGETMARLGEAWEWLIVDDHSRDDTFAVVERLARLDARIRGVRLARNCGSHIAIACGLDHVRGDAAVLLVADLQDPPETFGEMIRAWRAGAQVVWAVRRRHPGQRSAAGFSAVYYWVMRSVVGLTELPVGTDFFLVDRAAIDACRRFPERHVSIFALIASLGFRQAQIEYDKQPRAAGRSGWTLQRKIKLVVDSVTAFSDLPIRACTYTGLVLLVLGVLAAIPGSFAALNGGRGLWLVLAAIAGFTGLQLTALGIVGEYVWRALDEARRRPRYLIEREAGEHAPAVMGPPNGRGSSQGSHG